MSLAKRNTFTAMLIYSNESLLYIKYNLITVCNIHNICDVVKFSQILFLQQILGTVAKLPKFLFFL